MSYNILNKKVKFQGATQGTVEDIVDIHTNQSVSGSKDFQQLSGSNVYIAGKLAIGASPIGQASAVTVVGVLSASAEISGSAFYGDGSNLTGIDQVVTALNSATANELVVVGSTTTELDAKSELTFNGTVLSVTGVISGSGNVSGSAFYGSGVGLTGIPASSVTLAANSGLSASSGLIVDPTNCAVVGSLSSADVVLIYSNGNGGLRKTTAGAISSLSDVVTGYTNGTNDRVVTSTGADGINGEANLTFDSSRVLTVGGGPASQGSIVLHGNMSGSGYISASVGVFESSVTAASIDLGDASGIAGLGLANSSGQLDIAVTGAVKITSDKVALTGSIASYGLTYTGSADSVESLGLDIGGLTDANLTVSADHIPFVRNADGQTFRESFTDIVSNMAGNGLAGSSGQLAIGAGTGIDVGSNDISVDVSDFMANGANNRVVTATGADEMNAEANLTFDGNDLTLTGSILTRNSSNTAKIFEGSVGNSGSVVALRYKEMSHTCTTSAASEDIADFFAANMIPVALGIRITTAITRGDATSPHITKIGTINDDDSFGTFGDNDLEQSGDNLVTSYHPANATGQNTKWFTNNHELKITYNAQPAAGALRLGLYYYDITPPTS